MSPFLLVLLAASAAQGDPPGVRSLDLFARHGVADVLTAVRTTAGLELRHARSTDGGATWTAEVRLPVAGSDIKGAHRGNDPQIAADGERLVAVWTKPGTSPWGSGPLATALSSDGGKTWTAGPNPADDGSTGGHGYADLVVDTRGGFHLVWLDDRDGAQGLRAAASKDGGRTWSANATVDARTCECCWNRAAAAGDGGVAVLYRDKDPRDLAVAASADGRAWRRLGRAGEFGWAFDGCPHVGGGIAFTRRELHALAWTGAEAHAGMYAVRSPDGGATWMAPVRIGTPTAHRGDLAAAGDVVAAAWDDPVAARGAILGATSADGGRTWSVPRTLTAAGAAASHPAVAAVGRGRFLVAWVDTAGGTARWRSAALTAAAPRAD